MRGTVMTLGGGGFAMSEDGSSLLDDFLLSLVDKADPKMCFIGTASGDSSSFAQRFLAAFDGRAETSVLTLFGQADFDYADPSHVLSQDIVYVGGGSTANLLALWRLHGLDRHLSVAAANGTILAGISAGMNCWFEASSTDSFGPLAPLRDGLGFLSGSACPHYDGEEGRAEHFRRWIADGSLPPGQAADDGVGILWRHGEIIDVISERPGAHAYAVTPEGETRIEARYLG